ncbi:succinate dehydrogenase, hydrophobic membrane anchor protein [Lamprobacter modestohalophilus]|uniref:succinate dehydrogenase, hydrophobic membrane anchor protein n=1 Tax=Lamprobacter modestohalophilus TaxID=1064514 RepID=UPI002ADEEFEF|nr:succinate dehydrogenase, hydrophobic membrane anchor protein [Lamprobacter modestohalophilus]MEA1049953.1 succinate dehydrogenase, hydrophobic membrane anchor protein [Lamprobacter modestohalophilus]
MSRRASGLKAWLVQRVSAVYLGLFGLYLALYFAFAAPRDHTQLAAWASSPWVAVGLLVFIPLLLAHAWVGIRDVLIDYIKPIGLRVGLLSLFALVFLASGLWALQALILVQIG